jgi:alpha-beta hydrolase superfamily lysophospholipase
MRLDCAEGAVLNTHQRRMPAAALFVPFVWFVLKSCCPDCTPRPLSFAPRLTLTPRETAPLGQVFRRETVMNRRQMMAGALGGAMAAGTAKAAQPFTETAFELETAGFGLPCVLTRPGAAVKGAVLLLPGSLFNDVDGNYPSMMIQPHTYKDLATQLGALGYACLRMAKPGPGTGSRTIDAALATKNASMAGRVIMAHDALARLAAEVPGSPLIVAGHSEGALVANLLAAGEDTGRIKGVVSLSGPALRLLDIMRRQVGGMGMDLAAFDRAAAGLRAGKPIDPADAKDPAVGPLAQMPAGSVAYVVDVDRIDPLAAAAAVRQPMLLVQGGRDFSVSPDQVDALARARAGLPTKLARFPTLNHCYKPAPEALNAMQSWRLEGDSDPAVTAAIAAWAEGLGA